MAKPLKEKTIKIGLGNEFPVDLWSVSINLVTFSTIGPVNIIKKGTYMKDSDYNMFYTLRTRKEMANKGYSIFKLAEKPENIWIISTNKEDCIKAFHKESAELVTNVCSRLKRFKFNVLGSDINSPLE